MRRNPVHAAEDGDRSFVKVQRLKVDFVVVHRSVRESAVGFWLSMRPDELDCSKKLGNARHLSGSSSRLYATPGRERRANYAYHRESYRYESIRMNAAAEQLHWDREQRFRGGG